MPPSLNSLIDFVVLWLFSFTDVFYPLSLGFVMDSHLFESRFTYWTICSIYFLVVGWLKTIHVLQSPILFWAAVLAGITQASAAPQCPHCFSTFASCTYITDSQCPLVDVVAANARVIAAGAGTLTIAKIIKPRFLRLFSRVAFETILTLVKRKEPGAAFEITATTSATAIMTAVQSGQTTLEMVIFKLLELREAATEADVKENLKSRLEMLKVVSDIKVKLPSGAFSGLFDTGVLTFMWAKVSEFVMSKGMQVKLQAE